MANLLKPDRTYEILGVPIKEYLLTKHNPNNIGLPSKRTKKLIKITAHNTDDLERVEDDAEQYARATVNGNMKTVVPTMYVDDLGGWQLLPFSYGNWTCGGGGNSIGNSQTIALEIIMNDNPEHDAKARDNAARIIAWLLVQNGLKEDDVVSHTYWIHVNNGRTNPFTHPNEINNYINKWNNYKMCPLYILPTWDSFKYEIATYYRQLKGIKKPVKQPTQISTKPFIVRVIADELNVRTQPGTGKDSKISCIIHEGEAYTIIKTEYVGQVPWGRLRSDAGWISLLPKYVKKLT